MPAEARQRTNAALAELLRASLAMWRIDGLVHGALDDALLLAIGDQKICITRAPEDLPFRWMLTFDGRTRGAVSVAGVLRIVQQAAGFPAQPIRLKIASFASPPRG